MTTVNPLDTSIYNHYFFIAFRYSTVANHGPYLVQFPSSICRLTFCQANRDDSLEIRSGEAPGGIDLEAHMGAKSPLVLHGR